MILCYVKMDAPVKSIIFDCHIFTKGTFSDVSILRYHTKDVGLSARPMPLHVTNAQGLCEGTGVCA